MHSSTLSLLSKATPVGFLVILVEKTQHRSLKAFSSKNPTFWHVSDQGVIVGHAAHQGAWTEPVNQKPEACQVHSGANSGKVSVVLGSSD